MFIKSRNEHYPDSFIERPKAEPYRWEVVLSYRPGHVNHEGIETRRSLYFAQVGVKSMFASENLESLFGLIKRSNRCFAKFPYDVKVGVVRVNGSGGKLKPLEHVENSRISSWEVLDFREALESLHTIPYEQSEIERNEKNASERRWREENGIPIPMHLMTPDEIVAYKVKHSSVSSSFGGNGQHGGNDEWRPATPKESYTGERSELMQSIRWAREDGRPVTNYVARRARELGITVDSF